MKIKGWQRILPGSFHSICMGDPTMEVVRMKDNDDRSLPNFPIRIALPAVLIVLLLVAAIFFIIPPALEASYLAQKREMIRELTESAWSVFSMFEGRERAGLMTREEAQIQAIMQVRNLRYGPERKDYFWINDMHPRMVMHPYRLDLEGKDISNFKDPNDKRLFVELVHMVREHGAGYVDYMWQWKDNPGKIVPKLSYVKGFEPWEWIVGSGIYTDDIHTEMVKSRQKVFIVALSILFILFLPLFYLTRQVMLTNRNRKQTEDTLKEKDTHLQTLIRTIPDLVWLKDQQGVYLFCNPRFESFYGAREKDIIGKTDYDFVDNELADFFRKYDKVAMAKGKPSRNEEELTFADDGHREILEVIKTPMYRWDGQFSGVLGIGRDITERKRTEEKLRKSEIRFRNIFNQTFQFASIVALNGTLTAINQTSLDFIGAHETDVIGKPFWDTPWWDHSEEMREWLRNAVPRAARGEVLQRKVTHFSRHGDLHYFDFSLKPVVDENGKAQYLIPESRDITARKRAEAEKTRIEEQYFQAQKVEAIGKLAGGVAHDMNNLLTPILGYGEMLVAKFNPDDSRRRCVEQIVQAGMRARDLVRQLLAFGRKQTLEYKSLDINKIIEEFQALMLRTIREDIALEIIPAPGIPTVKADIGQIEQVIMNLVVNAQDSMPNIGRLTIETAMVEIDEDYMLVHHGTQKGHYVMLAVSDTGCGMDEETRMHIFEPFFSTKGENGTGLGLATVYGIVKQHEGNIWVYSEQGKGTTFKVYLPVCEEVHIKKQVREESTEDLRGSETILLVEDNEQVRDLAHAVLTQQGYTVLVAENGAEALTLLASHDGAMHLLLTDVIMPGMNGKEIFTRATATDKHPGLKVLYMSGYTNNVIAHHGVLDEGVQFIQKPFTFHGLATKVREVIETCI